MGKMIVAIALVIASLPVAAAEQAEQERTSFKGLYVGMPESEARARFSRCDPGWCATNIGETDEKRPRPDPENLETFAGLGVGYRVNFENGSVRQVEVLFLPVGTKQIVDALSHRYGKPDVLDTTPLQNGYGATFSHIAAVWNRADAQILVDRHPEATRLNAVFLMPAVDPAKAAAEHEQRMKDF